MAISPSQLRVRNELKEIGGLYGYGFIDFPAFLVDGSTKINAFIEGQFLKPSTNELLTVTITFSGGYPYKPPKISIEASNFAANAWLIEILMGRFLEKIWTAICTIKDILDLISAFLGFTSSDLIEAVIANTV